MPSGEPAFAHLAPQLAGVVAAFFPAPVEIRAMFLDGTCAEDRFSFWKIASADPTADRSSIDAQPSRYFRLREPVADLFHHRFISRHPAVAAPPPGIFGAGGLRSSSGRFEDRGFRRSRNSAGSLRHEPMMRSQSIGQSLAQIPKKVPSVRHLHRVRQRFVDRLGIEAGAIATDDFYPEFARSHAVALSALRSGSRSIALPLFRSHRIVP